MPQGGYEMAVVCITFVKLFTLQTLVGECGTQQHWENTIWHFCQGEPTVEIEHQGERTLCLSTRFWHLVVPDRAECVKQ